MYKLQGFGLEAIVLTPAGTSPATTSSEAFGPVNRKVEAKNHCLISGAGYDIRTSWDITWI